MSRQLHFGYSGDDDIVRDFVALQVALLLEQNNKEPEVIESPIISLIADGAKASEATLGAIMVEINHNLIKRNPCGVIHVGTPVDVVAYAKFLEMRESFLEEFLLPIARKQMKKFSHLVVFSNEKTKWYNEALKCLK